MDNPVPDSTYIRTGRARHDVRKLTLKHGSSFGVFDTYGDIVAEEHWELGVYHHGTRLLSHMELLIDDEPPLLLSSNVEQNNLAISIDLANPDILLPDGTFVPRGSLHGYRNVFLCENALVQEFRWHNYSDSAVEIPVTFHFNADFADIFEVRGQTRPRRGTRIVDVTGPSEVTFRYLGLDNGERVSRVTFSGQPDALSEHSATFLMRMKAFETVAHFMTVSLEEEVSMPADAATFATHLALLRRERSDAQAAGCEILTSNERFNDLITRSAEDLRMLTTKTTNGPYPFAGTPWFSTVFGRDGLWTALFCNWLNPELSRGVLRVLAATQAQEVSPENDAEPGKIIHEMRDGEMAALGEVPFRRYYGSVDATPLFVLLAARYFERTNDRALIEELWPNIEAALSWIDTYGDPDGDGFVEYHRQTETGLANQGWKDSHDSVFHADGTLAEGPIALSEVQAYVYAAKEGAARLASALGRQSLAATLNAGALHLKEHFEDAFWAEETGTYALALDGEKRQCGVISSNAGHVLMSGLCSAERAQLTADLLMSDKSFCGWGVRTVAEGMPRYNPMSYHNGSIWPHDNAIIAEGFARYGLSQHVARISEGLAEAARFMDLSRLPELFCGFPRRSGVAPTLYPVACAPQAWASASIFALLRASLGIDIRAAEQKLIFRQPFLPQTHDRVLITKLQVGEATLDLSLVREYQNVAVNVLRRTGEVDIVVEI